MTEKNTIGIVGQYVDHDIIGRDLIVYGFGALAHSILVEDALGNIKENKGIDELVAKYDLNFGRPLNGNLAAFVQHPNLNSHNLLNALTIGDMENALSKYDPGNYPVVNGKRRINFFDNDYINKLITLPMDRYRKVLPLVQAPGWKKEDLGDKARLELAREFTKLVLKSVSVNFQEYGKPPKIPIKAFNFGSELVSSYQAAIRVNPNL